MRTSSAVVLLTITLVIVLSVLSQFPETPTGEQVREVKTMAKAFRFRMPPPLPSLNPVVELRNQLLQRKEILLNLMEIDPDKALEFPELSEIVKARLSPGELNEFVEQRGAFSGELLVGHGDDFGNPENSFFDFYLLKDTKLVELFSSVPLPVVPSGSTVTLEGLALGDKLVVKSDKQSENNLPPITGFVALGVPRMNIQIPQLQPIVSGQKTLVLVVNWGNKPAPVTVDEARRLIFDNSPGTVQNFYKKNSFNDVFLTGDVFAVTALPNVLNNCKTTDMLKYSLEGAVKKNIPVSNYERIILFLTKSRYSCRRLSDGYGSIGKWQITLSNGQQIRASVSWNFKGGLHIPSHELGHNFGVDHTNAYLSGGQSCTDIYSPNCQSVEYANPFSIMGNNIGHHTAANKHKIGWVSNTNVKTTDKDGDYILTPIEKRPSPGNWVHQLRLPLRVLPNGYRNYPNDVFYSVEFRSPTDYDAPNVNSPTLFINVITDRFLTRNTLVGQYLQPGQAYVDTVNRYSVGFVTITPNGEAHVRIARI